MTIVCLLRMCLLHRVFGEKLFQQDAKEIIIRVQSVKHGELEDEMWLQLQFLLINKDSYKLISCKLCLERSQFCKLWAELLSGPGSPCKCSYHIIFKDLIVRPRVQNWVTILT